MGDGFARCVWPRAGAELALRRRGYAEWDLDWGVLCRDSLLTSLGYLMTLPYQKRGVCGDVAHSVFSLFWISVWPT